MACPDCATTRQIAERRSPDSERIPCPARQRGGTDWRHKGDQHRTGPGVVQMKHLKAVAATVIATSLLCGCGSAAGTPVGAGTSQQAPVPGSPSPAPAGSAAAAPCRAAVITLGYGQRLSPMTGEHRVMYTLTNRGRVSCTLAGYPDIALFTASGARLPFHYTRGHGEYVTSAPPTTAVLAPGVSAYVLVAKYRCDLGSQLNAAAIRLTLPGPQPVVLTGRVAADGAGVSELSYCRGGPADPGQVIAVSPIEPTPNATTAFASAAHS